MKDLVGKGLAWCRISAVLVMIGVGIGSGPGVGETHAAPDLTGTITKLKVKETGSGFKLIVKVDVCNIGDDTVFDPFAVSLFLSDDSTLDDEDLPLQSFLITKIKPNTCKRAERGKRKFKVPGLPSLNGAFAIIVLDQDEDIQESNEENNSLVMQIVTGSADISSGSIPPVPDALPDIAIPTLRSMNDWTCQLQGTDGNLVLEPIGASAFDLAVIDYSANGREAREFTAVDIAGLKNSPGGDKIVLAYMSIGEAEIGRFYFYNAWVTPDPGLDLHEEPFTLTAAAPDWLTLPNPNFPDNFKVHFWDSEWQQIIVSNPGGHPVIGDARSYLDRIIDAGFDGVFLDVVDAFAFFGPEEIFGNNERRRAAQNMVDFVISIADHARRVRGVEDFLVVPLNGANIIDAAGYPEDTLGPDDAPTPQDEAMRQQARYFAVISAIVTEDTFYFGEREENNPLNPRTYAIENLDRFRQAGLTVLALDYLTQTETIDNFYALSRQRGYVPYATIRKLDRVVVNPTQIPD